MQLTHIATGFVTIDFFVTSPMLGDTGAPSAIAVTLS